MKYFIEFQALAGFNVEADTEEAAIEQVRAQAIAEMKRVIAAGEYNVMVLPAALTPSGL